MSSLVMIALAGAVVAAALLSAVILIAIRPLLARYALARPNARSSHRIPTPQGGGVAVIAAALAVAGSTIAMALPEALPSLGVLFAATVLMAVIGAIDDIRPIPVAPRLLLQAAAVGAVLYALPTGLQIVPACPLWLERLVLLVAGLWFVNLVNFMDGLDWITAAEVIPVTAALALFGLFGALSPAAALVAGALGGAMLGFAPFNRPVAKIFLGDVGSLPIGLLLAWCFVELAFAGHLVAAILLPLYYLADATLTLLRRAARREAVWMAHRSHFYQRATDNGFAVIEVVRTVFGLNIALAVLAGFSVSFTSTMANVILLALGAIAVAMVLRAFLTPR
ncbi:glycosyltransferase family 4 protein [Tardiphaga sp. vice352]|uniref:MraY family glycosyltransferase n=1 Tax=unclassified Tardiphaga TaxID=2631404 RepID=UPI0011636ACF|nr:MULTISPECIES: glycosyltransferase family 4 protein [unclassified Tardiphaga]QDM17809.1 glycosyltransferase family 4 protein [Tardiphaga sp. vice278]QDM22869.1 glycosyltransferase family 4 protein [Tardiphaga sp. vice154]QDM28028.1 glycosyltransferase family 4 protein [Tardiphaga sp. vice304]QDM33170.1 glycosyltransferase family 4 protein [Tardiphaga sp. vice352]